MIQELELITNTHLGEYLLQRFVVDIFSSIYTWLVVLGLVIFLSLKENFPDKLSKFDTAFYNGVFTFYRAYENVIIIFEKE
jgi:hypothetical protein